jgi:hypothetical protein
VRWSYPFFISAPAKPESRKHAGGELFGIVAIGYLRTDDDRLEKDPDRRVQDAIALVFSKFADLQSARQVLLWMRQEKILLPTLVHKSDKRSIEWRAPKYRTIYHILTNPVYGGAYAFGRTKDVAKSEHGHKQIIRRKFRNWSQSGCSLKRLSSRSSPTKLNWSFIGKAVITRA